MSSLTTDIADAITTAINVAAGTLSQEITAERKWRAKEDLKDLAATVVSVIPGPISIEPMTRGENDDRRSVDVAVQKKVNPDSNTDVDPLILLVEEIADLFLRGQFATSAGVKFTVTSAKTIPSNAAAVDDSKLDGWRVFTAVLRLECFVQR